MARPPPQPNVTELEKLGMLQCTYEEVAAWFNTTKQTIVTKMKMPEYREAFERGQGKGRVSLRRTQFRLAEKSAGMAIWLGKQVLGQKDVQVHEHTEGEVSLFDLVSSRWRAADGRKSDDERDADTEP